MQCISYLVWQGKSETERLGEDMGAFRGCGNLSRFPFRNFIGMANIIFPRDYAAIAVTVKSLRKLET
jgi:hypothetical protein